MKITTASEHRSDARELGPTRRVQNAGHPCFEPRLTQEGCFVVPCTGNAVENHGGRLIPEANNWTGLDRRSSYILGLFMADEKAKSDLEKKIDADAIAMIVKQTNDLEACTRIRSSTSTGYGGGLSRTRV